MILTYNSIYQSQKYTHIFVHHTMWKNTFRFCWIRLEYNWSVIYSAIWEFQIICCVSHTWYDLKFVYFSDAAVNISSDVSFNENFTFLAHGLDTFLIAKGWSINNVTEKSRKPLLYRDAFVKLFTKIFNPAPSLTHK